MYEAAYFHTVPEGEYDRTIGMNCGVVYVAEPQAIGAIAEKYGVSIPQLCIKYDLQLDMVVLPKTANPDHMRANADLGFTISDEDMETLKAIKPLDYGEASYFPVYGGKL